MGLRAVGSTLWGVFGAAGTEFGKGSVVSGVYGLVECILRQIHQLRGRILRRMKLNVLNMLYILTFFICSPLSYCFYHHMIVFSNHKIRQII